MGMSTLHYIVSVGCNNYHQADSRATASDQSDLALDVEDVTKLKVIV